MKERPAPAHAEIRNYSNDDMLVTVNGETHVIEPGGLYTIPGQSIGPILVGSMNPFVQMQNALHIVSAAILTGESQGTNLAENYHRMAELLQGKASALGNTFLVKCLERVMTVFSGLAESENR